MVVGKNTGDMKMLSFRKGFPLLIMLNHGTKNYRGLIRITDEPMDMGKFYWLEFHGVDALQAK